MSKGILRPFSEVFLSLRNDADFTILMSFDKINIL